MNTTTLPSPRAPLKCVSNTGRCPVVGCEEDGVCYLAECEGSAARQTIVSLLLIAAFCFTGSQDYAEEKAREARALEQRQVRDYPEPELLCGCRKLNGGHWLRLQITHQPDRKFCTETCIYEGGTYL